MLESGSQKPARLRKNYPNLLPAKRLWPQVFSVNILDFAYRLPIHLPDAEFPTAPDHAYPSAILALISVDLSPLRDRDPLYSS
jgi:hypothetical protein